MQWYSKDTPMNTEFKATFRDIELANIQYLKLLKKIRKAEKKINKMEDAITFLMNEYANKEFKE